MRILFISPRYHPHVGGVEYVVKSVAERLTRMNNKISVLCGEQGLTKPRESLINGVSVIRWPVWVFKDAYHIPRMVRSFRKRLLESAKDYDVIHFHSVHNLFSIYAFSVLKESSTRLVITPHYHETGHYFMRKVLWIPWRRYVVDVIRCADAVHAVSSYEREILKRIFGVKCIVIEHGVEEWIGRFEWRPENYILYSGRLERYKNVDRLAKIVKVLNSMYGLDFELKVNGDGPYRDKLAKFFNKLRLKYEMIPFRPYKEYIGTLSRAMLLANLSKREAFGITVNEANAIGVPAVVAEPWGKHFQCRSKILVVDLSERDSVIATNIANFLKDCKNQPRSMVPSWSRIVEQYVDRLYK